MNSHQCHHFRAEPSPGPPGFRRSAVIRLMVLVALLFAFAPAPPARAVSCPSGGAKVKVCVTNPTSQPASITVSGTALSPGFTCTAPPPILGTYSETLVANPNVTTCTSPIPSGGLLTGLYLHRINVSSTQQDQYQKGVVLYDTDPSNVARVDWTYFSSVIRVGNSGDAGGGSCPINAPASPTCDVRSAVAAANGISGNTPVLIQFNTSPGTLSGANLTITRTKVTMDGTDANGNPRIVGDPNAAAAGNQGPFPTVLEFSPFAGIRVNANGVTLQGLDLRQSPGSGNPQAHLIQNQAGVTGTAIKASRLDGGTNTNCFAPGATCTEAFDLVNVPSRPGTASTPDVTLDNVEARSAIDKGLQLGTNVWGEVDKSWVRNNYKGNVDATSVSQLIAERSVVERAGLRASDDLQVDLSASGLNVSTSGFVATDASVFRNNVLNGVRASGISVIYQPKDDYICGNGSDGLRSLTAGGGSPSINGLGGITTAYNQAAGAKLDTVVNAANLDNDSSFTANVGCGLVGNTPGGPGVSALNDQWRGSGPPFADACGNVITDSGADATNSAITLIATTPTNAILLGQTVRVLGSGFNSITGNPLAGGGGCTTGFNGTGSAGGQPNSCCKKTTRANTCGPGDQNPVAGAGNCVEMRGRDGVWRDVGVRSETPRMIETAIPETVFGCIGQQGEQVSVCKRGDVDRICGFFAYCNNSISF